jgi:hypothetical protein
MRATRARVQAKRTSFSKKKLHLDPNGNPAGHKHSTTDFEYPSILSCNIIKEQPSGILVSIRLVSKRPFNPKAKAK